MTCFSPVLRSCSQIADCCAPAVVMNDLPLGIMASPSSSLAPDKLCSEFVQSCRIDAQPLPCCERN